jgi:hypothetical protein
MARVGRGLRRAGSSVLDRAPEEGHIHDAAEAVADRFDRAGRYLQDRDWAGMAEDLSDVVRRYPLQSLLVGLGLGYFAGRLRGR